MPSTVPESSYHVEYPAITIFQDNREADLTSYASRSNQHVVSELKGINLNI